jgi:hypothetical protein
MKNFQAPGEVCNSSGRTSSSSESDWSQKSPDSESESNADPKNWIKEPNFFSLLFRPMGPDSGFLRRTYSKGINLPWFACKVLVQCESSRVTLFLPAVRMLTHRVICNTNFLQKRKFYLYEKIPVTARR